MRLTILLWSLCFTMAAHGAEPVTVHHGQLADFLGGEAEGVTLHADGRLTLGPQLAPLMDIGGDRIWSMATDHERLYVGSGDEGTIHIIESGQLVDSLSVGTSGPMALAAASGVIYIGTGPAGRLLRHRDGTTETLLTTSSQYVWDLALDGETILLACGAEAGVLRWHPKGDVDTLLRAPTDGHVRVLAPRQEHWLAGTAVTAGGDETVGHGRVYELDGRGGSRLLLETEEEEVVHLVVVGDVTYIAAMTVPTTGDPSVSLLRLNADGASYTVWRGTGIWAGLVRDGEDILAITREPTRVLRLPVLGPTDRPGSILAQTDSLSPSAVVQQADGLILGDSQSGNLWRLPTKATPRGHFDAPVYDAGNVATWGALTWTGRGQVHLRTRSGNSDEPDDTWSDWSGSRSSGQTIASPPAHYLQYQVRLEDDGDEKAEVERISFRLRQANVPPRIEEVITFPYRGGASALQNPEQIPGPGLQRNHSNGTPQPRTLRVVRWKASDPNGDPLRFDIFLRGDGHKTWKLIKADVEGVKTIVWDTERMPEGLTRLKVVASDALSNPASRSLQDSYITAPFTIDNTPPVVHLQARRERGGTIIEAKLTDAISTLRGARFGIDYDEVTTHVAASDGLFDTRQEQLRFKLPALPAGEHVISVQAWDELENIGVAQILIMVEP